MTARCLSCLRPCGGAGGGSDLRHERCSRELFGTTHEPEIDVEVAKLHTFGLAMAGRTTLSGAQRKVSLSLSADRATLRVALEGAQYVLKPQAAAFPALPENEHVTMLLARAAGIETPPFGLVRLRDGTTAYLAARFDRRAGRKIRMEDFCQLAEKSPKEKYEGSAELLVRLVRRFASEPGIEVARLFRQLVFAWWTGNGDLHMKNLSMVADGSRHRLSPAYDLLSTRLVIADDPLALPVGGRRNRLGRGDWMRLAAYARIPQRATERILDDVLGGLDAAVAVVESSYLDPPLKSAYAALLRERAQA